MDPKKTIWAEYHKDLIDDLVARHEDMKRHPATVRRPGIGAVVAMVAASQLRWNLWRLPPAWRRRDTPVWEVFEYYESDYASLEEATKALYLAERDHHVCNRWCVLREGLVPHPELGAEAPTLDTLYWKSVRT